MKIGDEFKDYFANKALAFMDKNPVKKDEMSVHTVFVEQRLLSMCAKQKGIKIRYFLDEFFGKNIVDGTKNNLFTHIWLYKSVLKTNKFKRQDFCLRCINRILKDFPEYEEKLQNIPTIKTYMASLYN